MADISMCKDEECDKRVHCYRYRARPNPYRQSYFIESPRNGIKCDYYSSTSGWDDGHLTPMNELETPNPKDKTEARRQNDQRKTGAGVAEQEKEGLNGCFRKSKADSS